MKSAKHKAQGRSREAKEVIFFNGRFVKKEEAVIPAWGEGALYGWGVFETMRSLGGRIVYLNEHLARLKDSCAALNIKLRYTADKLKKALKEASENSDANDVRLRLSVWKNSAGNSDVCVMVRKYKPFPEGKYKQGFSCMVHAFRQNENSLLAQHKTTNYLFYRLAHEQACAQGFDEAIVINNSGYLAEASRANLFMVKGAKLFTPKLECGCLDGITRKVVFNIAKKSGISIEEGNFTLQDLYNCQEAFLTNSLIGIMPVKSVENISFMKLRPQNSLAEFFAKKYKIILRNGH